MRKLNNVRKLNEDFTKLYKRWKGGSVRKEEKIEFIDLGLPSGLLWASCNVGATDVLDSGGCYAWGEKKEKNIYNEDSYEFDIEPYNANEVSKLPENLFGGEYRVPTNNDFAELFKYTKFEEINNFEGSGMTVVVLTPKKCNKKIKPKLIIPLCGYKLSSTIRMEGYMSILWTSIISKEYNKARCISIGFSNVENKSIYVYTGCNVRLVKDKI